MARYKHPSFKSKLIKARKNTKWAPAFAILKKFGKGKRIHPSQLSQKRSWRRGKLKI
jgi:ribosomal protein L39E